MFEDKKVSKMVNMTESFTKTFGRFPTEEEIGTLMKLKAEQEGYKATKFTPPTSKANGQHVHKGVHKKKFVRMTKTNKQINNLLIKGLSPKDIADGLMLRVETVKSAMDKYALPRDGLYRDHYPSGGRKPSRS